MKHFFKNNIPKITLFICMAMLFTSCQNPQNVSTNKAGEKAMQTDNSSSQKPAAENKIIADSSSRYIKQMFENVDVESDIIYKEVKNSRGENESLKLDVYKPSGDTASNRSAIIWIHGGSFTSGDKVSNLTSLAVDFAKMGYVTLSINYRLRDNPSADWKGTFKDSTEDAAAAVDWLVKNSEKYGVDKNHIALGGFSAGSDIAINLVYKDGQNANWNKKSIFAVIDLAGSTAWMGKMDKNDPPCIVIHGTNDTTVDFSESEAMAKALKDAGIKYTYHPVKDGIHSLDPMYNEVFEVTKSFLYKALTNMEIETTVNYTGTSGTAKAPSATIEVSNNVSYTFEIEDFELSDGKLTDAKDASSGKAAIASTRKFKATKKVKIDKPGKYAAILYMNAKDGKHDAVNVTINANPVVRTYAQNYNVYDACKVKIPFEVTQAGDQTITVSALDEYGMALDKLEVREVVDNK